MTQDLGDKTGSHASHEAAKGASSPSVSIPIAELVANLLACNPDVQWTGSTGLMPMAGRTIQRLAAERNGMVGAEILPDAIGELRLSARMIRTWIPETFPANEAGQVHFVRAIMESVADVIERATAAQGIEAGTAETALAGSVHESPIPAGGCAQ